MYGYCFGLKGMIKTQLVGELGERCGVEGWACWPTDDLSHGKVECEEDVVSIYCSGRFL